MTITIPKIHSPFKIVSAVRRGGVTIALIQTPDITVEQHVSLTDLSYLTSENLSTYFGGLFPITDPTTGLGFAGYTGQIDTDDARLSNRSVMKRDVKEPTPLFYRYVVGRGRRFVYQENALTAEDVDVIRRGVEIIDGDGQKMSFERFPWDIEVSDHDETGIPLPANVFAVTLFATLPFIEGVSVMIRYTAADSLRAFEVQPNFLEFVNPEPAMGRVDADPGYDQFTLEFQGDGRYEAVVGTTGL